MKDKKLILAAIALVVVIAVAVGIFLLTRPRGNTEEKTFTLTVTHADGSKKDFTITTSREFLSQALLDEKIIESGGADEGMYNIVDGESAVYTPENPVYWGFYVGGEYAALGMDQTPIEEGAVYELRYEVSNW